MGSLGAFDIIWRVVVAGVLAATPGIVFWTLVFGLMAAVGRFGNRRGVTRQAKRAVVS